jgi:hypothetical protein
MTAAITRSTSADSGEMLRRVMLADGVVSGSTGLLLALAAGPLADLLGLPGTLLRLAGIGLIPFAALVIVLATRATLSRLAVWDLIALNLLWVAGSLVLLLSGWVDPTAVGVAFTLAQALIVAAFAELQYIGLRRMR